MNGEIDFTEIPLPSSLYPFCVKRKGGFISCFLDLFLEQPLCLDANVSSEAAVYRRPVGPAGRLTTALTGAEAPHEALVFHPQLSKRAFGCSARLSEKNLCFEVKQKMIFTSSKMENVAT